MENRIRIIGDTDDIILEEMEGVVLENPSLYEYLPQYRCIAVKERKQDKVVVLANNGGGAEPMFAGLAGEGMADAVCTGHLFSAPSAYHIYESAKYIYAGKGVLLLTGNFTGDFLNNDLAAELLEIEGYQARCVYVRDDIGAAGKDHKERRGGIGGMLWVLKMASAAASMGLDLDEVENIARIAADHIYTLPIVFDTGYLPVTGTPMFQMPVRDHIEFGMGFNGEPGFLSMKMPKAGELAEKILTLLLDEFEAGEQDHVCLMVNSLGSLGFLDLHVLEGKIIKGLRSRDISVYDAISGWYSPIQGMGGITVTLLHMVPELKPYYDYPAYTPFYMKGSPSMQRDV